MKAEWFKPNRSSMLIFAVMFCLLVVAYSTFGRVEFEYQLYPTAETPEGRENVYFPDIIVFLVGLLASYGLSLLWGRCLTRITVFRPYVLMVWVLLLAYFSATGGELYSVIILAAVGTPFFLLMCWLWPKRWSFKSPLPGNHIIVPCCVVLIASVAITHWPLRLQYYIARSEFNRIADLVQSGEVPAMPVNIGLLTIRKAEVHHDEIVCLWTDVDPAGDTGFVRTSPDYVPFNLWSKVSLDDQWQFISED